ncbi:Rnf-Nqr domain containing protein [Pseudomonas sp. NPDC087612]|uniref:Rnf-Nqr domain containing protein n=1 Tax=unclassified Pseudomonas TaxID=196821 RepID=UPI0005EB542F|nr:MULTISPECIES: Rnf-Nqr domain containing protein [unclassified Pseudomonas]KJK17659.1 NADH:quinone oxidoreductase [Pseudomonas sp. 2(2015)]QVM97880.1 NADH:quinone oxidoreductase [Pseudomonas sp. SORT22]UVL55242.1 NADH:quinone oxidoreductase [Pseudomonas sp. B21-035]UVL60527.1 NADH:quinone oxidoreductase [Pseudomonas sp. B21-032]UVM54808.1 NADH:quinone oxidoreductase [Pseudomonas sp. B21-012]
MSEFFLALVSAALINNLVLHQGLAIDPLLRSDTDPDRRQVHALGLATLVSLVVAVGLGQLIYHLALLPLQLEYLRLFVFLALCVLPIKPLLAVLTRLLPTLPFDGLLPLMVGNLALLGLSLQASEGSYGILQTLGWSLGGGLGFWLALGLFSDLRQRSDHDDIPLAFRGLPIELIGAGIMAMAFLGFNGLFNP